jgi:hypothetical protein
MGPPNTSAAAARTAVEVFAPFLKVEVGDADGEFGRVPRGTWCCD